MDTDSSGEPGRGFRRGWGQMALLVRPAILLLLRQDPAHGYTLIEDLRQEDLIDEGLDPGVVYRHLRELEEEGLLSSEWQVEGGGPPRRVYQLTPRGQDFLHGCMERLRRTRRRIDRIFDLYQQQFPLQGKP